MSSYRRSPGPQKSNMRMDRKPNATRISDPSHPAGKRREIDNVMKKARQAPPNEYWDKKLLEAEEKDPGRWKHTGYKKMYVNGVRKSRSRSPLRKTPVSPHRVNRHVPQSPVRRRMSPEFPARYKPRSPPPSRYPREIVKPKPESYRSAKGRPMSPPPKGARTPSISSCSDDSCSVCSSDDGRREVEKTRVPRYGPMNRSRVMSPDSERISSKKGKHKVISPKRHRLKRPETPEKPSRRAEAASTAPIKKKDKADKIRTRIKVEGEKRRRTPSTASEDSTSSGSSFPALTATTRITLSERFGKIAQWSNDRKYDMNNMKITKSSEGGDRSAVMIQEQQIRESPPVRSFSQFSGEGHYPEEMLAHSSASALGLAWDDVRVRFDYYKSKGYLRDLTLADYQAWENWWYRYQNWLKQERYFEMIERNMMRRRRKKIPIQQRLN